MTIACLIISYARKDNILQLIKEVSKAGIEKIYISIDGPRTQEIENIQLELKSELGKIEGVHLEEFRIRCFCNCKSRLGVCKRRRSDCS
jgi:hypothetical protein